MLANGVKETTATTGTGTVTLTAATGFVRFSQAFSVGQLVPYGIQNGNDWEWGYGTVAAANTLERTLITAKYAAGTYTNTGTITPLTLSGSATVICGESASVTPFEWPAMAAGAFGHKAVWPSNTPPVISGSFAVVADRLYMAPIRVDMSGECNGFRPVIATGAAGNMRLGLYQAGADGYPGALIVESVEQDTSASGQPLVDAATSRFIPRGTYYLGMLFSSTPAVARTNAASQVSPLGTNSSDNNGGGLIYKAYTYGALPSSGGASGWTISATPNIPTSAVRFA